MRYPAALPSKPLIVATLTLGVSSALAHLTAISVPFGPDYIGYDGAFSPVQIRVGTPEQYLLVFPSTTSAETWVAGQTLCEGTTCASLRGGIFYTSNSTSWQTLGQFELGYSALSQTTSTGNYGFDSVALTDTISASDQIVAVVDDGTNWNGHLGLGVQETRFNNNTNFLSLISSLVQNTSTIPSHSYGYTAGASYRGTGVQGSLTLGGVDTTRFASSNSWFTLASGYVPSVVLQSFQVTAAQTPPNWNADLVSFMPRSEAAAFTIDSSTSFLWMPESVCDNVAQALNLTWNSDIQLYTFANDTSPQDLAALDLEFIFTIANSTSSSNTTSVKVSYSAFNLQLSYPFPGLFTAYNETKVNYFPLRRANSTQQYTIGRSFLQEAYLIVDYERNVFSLSQALFPDSSQQSQLSVITRPADSIFPGPNNSASSGLSTGAKAGIAVGAIVVAILIVLAIWFYCFRRKGKVLSDNDDKSQRTGLLSLFSRRSTRRSHASATGSAAELNADKHHPTEMVSDATNSRYELSSTAPLEMPAADVAPVYFQERTNACIPQRNDPRSPIEMVQPQPRSSISKSTTDEDRRENGDLAAPAYSPTDINQRHSASVSPYSPRRSSNPFRNNSDNGISPVSGSHSDSDRERLRNARGSMTNSDSSRFLSPISQRPGSRGDGQRLPVMSRNSIAGDNTQIHDTASPGSLSPSSAQRNVPRRTPSRDSRFKEELTEDPTPTSAQESTSSEAGVLTGNANQIMRPQRSPRFSYEQ